MAGGAAEWRDLTAAAEGGHGESMLCLYTEALRLRRSVAALGEGELTWNQAPDGVLSFDRGGSIRTIANLSAAPVNLPSATVLLASGPLAGGQPPPDITAWLAIAG